MHGGACLRTVAFLALPCVLLSVALGGGMAQAGTAHHARHNLPPHPDFLQACVMNGALSNECISQTVAAINHARAREQMRHHKLVLPRNYRSLTRPQQTFVVINLERVDRGIRPLRGMVGLLNTVAGVSALVGVDPAPATLLMQSLGVHRFQTLWAQDYGVLASDYEWMYDDGYAGELTTNIGCSYAGAPGCWAHRHGMLARFPGLPLLLAGTGAANASGGADSITAILTGGYGRAPHFTYTWREARSHGADSHRGR